LASALTYDFVRHAIFAGVLAAILCGVVGTFVVVKRVSFLAGGLSHAAFGGLGICFFLGINPLWGAIAVSLGCAVVLGLMDTEKVKSHDALIGVLWAAGVAVGIAFVYRTPGYAPNLMTYLFGNILLVTPADVWTTLVLTVVVLAVFLLFGKELVAVSFDEVFARVQGAPVRLLLTLLLVLVALTVVVLIQVVGILLVIALLTIPPVVSLMLFKNLRSVLLTSVAIGVAMTLAGLAVSFYEDLPSGPAIVLLGTALLLLVYGVQKLRGRSFRLLAPAKPQG
ncbi:MAG: zinc transport system permease protein, partial [Acidobacteriota bacterium]|nr:zinc transport system permease protein [Acidobacteriota bacterium]